MKSGPDCPRVILGSLAVLGLIPSSLTGLTVDTRFPDYLRVDFRFPDCLRVDVLFDSRQGTLLS